MTLNCDDVCAILYHWNYCSEFENKLKTNLCYGQLDLKKEEKSVQLP